MLELGLLRELVAKATLIAVPIKSRFPPADPSERGNRKGSLHAQDSGASVHQSPLTLNKPQRTGCLHH
jgi:hypothetical protein